MAPAAQASVGSSRRFTKKQAEAFVHAVNLRAADVPGFKASKEHEHETAAEKHLERKMLRCTGGVGFNKGLAKAPESHGMTASPVSVSPLSVPAPGTAGSFGWRMTATITLHGIRIPFSMDLLGFVDGQVEVGLFAYGLPEPFPATTEQRLLSLLVKRARAHLV